jgi:hypothetical protein
MVVEGWSTAPGVLGCRLWCYVRTLRGVSWTTAKRQRGYEAYTLPYRLKSARNATEPVYFGNLIIQYIFSVSDPESQSEDCPWQSCGTGPIDRVSKLTL